MLKIFVKIMEQGITFPLILGMLAAYYRPELGRSKMKFIGISAGLGFLLALISAYVRSVPHLVNRTNLSFYSMIPVVFSCILLWMLLGFEQKLKRKNTKRFEQTLLLTVGLYIISSCTYYMPVFFLQINGFVYYGESPVSTIVMFRILGFIAAVLLMILSLIIIYRTSMKLELKQIRMVLIPALVVRSIPQINVIASRLYSLGIIPKNGTTFSVITTITNYRVYFDFILMAILVTAPLLLWLKNIKITETFFNHAQKRKIVYNMRKNRHLAQFYIFLMVLNILSLTAIKTYAYREIPLSAPENYEFADGHIMVPLDTLEDGHLHRYEYVAKDGNHVRFIIIKKSGGAYGVGLDACEICGASGYFERKDQVVCKLCDVVMNKGTIGFAGGCNPIPFAYKVHDGKIKIDVAVLEEKSYIFK